MTRLVLAVLITASVFDFHAGKPDMFAIPDTLLTYSGAPW